MTSTTRNTHGSEAHGVCTDADGQPDASCGRLPRTRTCGEPSSWSIRPGASDRLICRITTLAVSTWILTHLTDIADAALAIEATVETPGPGVNRASRRAGRRAATAMWATRQAPRADETVAGTTAHAEVGVATQVGGPFEAALVALVAVGMVVATVWIVVDWMAR